MEYNINVEMQNALKLLQETKEAYDKAQGRVEYIQSIIQQMNAEVNNNGVITQEDFDLSASSS